MQRRGGYADDLQGDQRSEAGHLLGASMKKFAESTPSQLNLASQTMATLLVSQKKSH